MFCDDNWFMSQKNIDELRGHPDYLSLVNLKKEGCPFHPNDLRIMPNTYRYDNQFKAYKEQVLDFQK
jgi:hypothetical protein